MIGADHLVAVGDVCARSQEQRAVILHFVEEHIRIAGHHLHVLGRDAVRLVDHLGFAVADDHLADNPSRPDRPRRRWEGSSAAARLPLIVSRASFSELVIRTAGEVGPCSAWPSRSVAQISPSTLSSAMIKRLGRARPAGRCRRGRTTAAWLPPHRRFRGRRSCRPP